MPTRGFIICIENYPFAATLAKKLGGTWRDGAAFHDWLVQKKAVAPQNISFFTDDPAAPGRTGGVTCAEILKGLITLAKDGLDGTGEFYFFFSGHGFHYNDRYDGFGGSDVLVASDFQDNALASLHCINLREVQQELSQILGFGDQYFFIDACRNEVTSKQVAGGAKFTPDLRSKQRRPTVYTLYSTRRGTTARADSGFGTHLIAGLGGAGHAKVWAENTRNTMLVLFSSVKNYVAKKLSDQEIDAELRGGRNGEILQFPPRKYRCDIEIYNADPGDQFDLSITNGRGQTVAVVQFEGRQHQFEGFPDAYLLNIAHPKLNVEPTDQLVADLYDDCRIKFKVAGALPVRVRLGGLLADVTINVPKDAHLELRNLDDGARQIVNTKIPQSLVAGPYLAKLKDFQGTTILRKNFIVEAGTPQIIDLAARPRHALQDEIASRLPDGPGGVEFSEQIGPLPDNDLALWLSIMGASRIVADGDSFTKMKDFPLQQFDDYREGDAPVFVLAGFAARRKVWGMVTSATGRIRRLLDPVRGFDNLYQHVSKVEPGPHIMWLRPEGMASIALATVALANRATLIVLAEDATNQFAIRQFILPIHSLRQFLDPYVRSMLPVAPLEEVKMIAQSQRDFARYRDLAPDGREPSKFWREFVQLKWTDPVLAIIGAYELIRQGETKLLSVVIKNLRQFFPGIPDTEALAHLAGLPSNLVTATPMLLEGLLAVEGTKFQSPFPRQRLDFRGPWSMWRSAET